MMGTCEIFSPVVEYCPLSLNHYFHDNNRHFLHCFNVLAWLLTLHIGYSRYTVTHVTDFSDLSLTHDGSLPISDLVSSLGTMSTNEIKVIRFPLVIEMSQREKVVFSVTHVTSVIEA